MVKFSYIVCSTEESYDVTTLSLDEMHSSMKVHEQKMKGKKEEEQALKVMSAGKFGGRGRGGRGNGG